MRLPYILINSSINDPLTHSLLTSLERGSLGGQVRPQRAVRGSGIAQLVPELARLLRVAATRCAASAVEAPAGAATTESRVSGSRFEVKTFSFIATCFAFVCGSE